MPRALNHHPKRFPLTNELHARPFQPMQVPGRVVHLAFKHPEGAVDRDPAEDRAQLIAFLDRHGAPHPAPEANHFVVDLGRFRLTWERHTEFVSYTLFEEGPVHAVFSGALVEVFPEDWLARMPGAVIAANEIELIRAESEAAADEMLAGPLGREFNPESLAVARVLDGAALALGDFRIHEEGFARFAVLIHDEVGPRRLGRLVQRLIEIETYRTAAMLALPIAREKAKRLNEIERNMSLLIGLVAEDTRGQADGAILATLTELAAELEAMSAATAFRFGAAAAYKAIVAQRIESLREERVGGRQLFSEFMARRFEPAMRTCQAVERRLSDLSIRAGRIAELLRTRVNVAVEEQNQKLLASMDKRAELQLRLQQTVEGLSVVAISYYAVSLGGYLIKPVSIWIDVSRDMLSGIIAIPTVVVVWWFVTRIRRGITHSPRRGRTRS